MGGALNKSTFFTKSTLDLATFDLELNCNKNAFTLFYKKFLLAQTVYEWKPTKFDPFLKKAQQTDLFGSLSSTPVQTPMQPSFDLMTPMGQTTQANNTAPMPTMQPQTPQQVLIKI